MSNLVPTDSFAFAIDMTEKGFKQVDVLPPSDKMGALDTEPESEFEQLTLSDIQNATHNHMTVSFDWMEFTIKTDDWKDVVMGVLDLDPAEFTALESGGRGYKQSQLWSLGNVRVFYEGNENMGVHVSMSGDGCRAYFGKKSPSLLILRIKQYHGTFSRVDCAIDDIGAEYFTVQQIIDHTKNNEVISKWRNVSVKQEFGISTLEKTSDIIYFGSMQSNTFLRVYDKRLEQESKGIACLSDWVRWEVVYRDEKADALIDQLITYNFDLGAVVVGVLSYYLRIAVANPLDSNRSRWDTLPLWARFIDGVAALRLAVIKSERTIDTIKDWLTKQVMPSLSAVLEAEGDFEWIVENIMKNRYRISSGVWDMIRLYKHSKAVVA